MLEITAAGMRFVARWEDELAPKTVAAFKAILPLDDQIIHCRWSGESNWIPWGDRDLGIGPENATSYPHPGELALYPGGQSETELLFPYGYCSFASKAGHLWANHFATLVEGQAQLRELGRLTLWQGAQPISFKERSGRQGRASSTYAFTRSSFPFILNPVLASTSAPAGSSAWVVRADQHSAGWGEALQTRARVDRVAHQRVRDVTVSSDLANHRLAAVHADPQARPAGMLVRESLHRALQGESRARSPERVVGLIAPAVERGDDPVADELLDLAAEPTGEQRRRRAPVRIQHCRDLGRR